MRREGCGDTILGGSTILSCLDLGLINLHGLLLGATFHVYLGVATELVEKSL